MEYNVVQSDVCMYIVMMKHYNRRINARCMQPARLPCGAGMHNHPLLLCITRTQHIQIKRDQIDV